jgi:hypothetical protein
LLTHNRSFSEIVIIGFNTDIEHDGVVYHVQTEDKGLASPLILSLVYAGGAILAAKRSRYEDLIAAGFDEEALAVRVKRQHRLICAAINAGRIEDLKRMGAPRAEDFQTEVPTPAEEIDAPMVGEIEAPSVADGAISNADDIELVSNADDYAALAEASPPALLEEIEVVRNADDYAAQVQDAEPPPPPLAAGEPDEPSTSLPSNAASSAYTVYDSRRQSPLGEAPEPERNLVVSILDEQEYWAGQSIQLRILIEDRSGDQEKPLAGASISVKILGTTFRPQIYSVKTERNGVAVVSAQVPKFTSGRAAILIRAVANDRTAETRRVIHST